MNLINIDWATVFACVSGAIGVYTVIRSDLAQLNARAHLVEQSAHRAHERIDSILNNGE